MSFQPLLPQEQAPAGIQSVPAQAGIHKYQDKNLSYFWFPGCAGTSLDPCLRMNDEVRD